jgi:hypothetical protein
MAVFLHPQYKLGWFKKHWSWDDYNQALAYIKKQYTLTKIQLCVTAPTSCTDSRPQSKEFDAYDAYNRLSSPTEDDQDDLYRYKSERIVPFGTDALQWWRDNQHLYPILKHLVFTYLAAPASSAANERLFSIAGNVVNEERPHTQASLAEAVQCLRS